MTHAADRLGLELDPLEIHSGIPLNDRRSPLPDLQPIEGTPNEVLEQILLPALQKPPFCVAFSGGRDSSALLARATQVARKHALADPVPITYVFSKHPRTDESEWQEMTIRHLGLSDWRRIELDTEFDVLGPIAQEVLTRYGLYWPPNAHNLIPLVRAAAGGTLATGNGGDELFMAWPWRRIARVRRLEVRPRKAELRYLGLTMAPSVLRRATFPFISSFGLPWLRPRALRAIRRRYADTMGWGPWGSSIESLIGSRYRELSTAIFCQLANDAGTHLLEPFSDPRYIRSVIKAAPRDGFTSRDDAMDTLFGDVLPQEVARRSTKAVFTEVNFGAESRKFAKSWDGTGVDHRIVSEQAVRAAWSSERPPIQSWTMLQSAWLARA